MSELVTVFGKCFSCHKWGVMWNPFIEEAECKFCGTIKPKTANPLADIRVRDAAWHVKRSTIE